MPTRVGLTLAVTFVDLTPLLDISSAAPAVAGGPSIAPGVFDDKLQDGLALAGALAVGAVLVPPPPPVMTTGPTGANTAVVADVAATVPAVPVVATTLATSVDPSAADPVGPAPVGLPPTPAASGQATDTAATPPEPGTTPVAPPNRLTPTTVTATAIAAAAATLTATTTRTGDAPTTGQPTDASPTGTVPVDAPRSGLAQRLLGGLRRGQGESNTGSQTDPTLLQSAASESTATPEAVVSLDAARETEGDTAGDTTATDTDTDTTASDTTASDTTAAATDTSTTATTDRAAGSVGRSVHSDTNSGGSAPTTTGPDGATGTGQFHTDKVRYLRDLAPAREIQRLAVDLDDARVAVRFGAGAATVDVVSDPSSRLDAGWVSSVEKTLRQMDTPAASPSGGSRDDADNRQGGQDRSMHDERRRRALEDATQRRWHDATQTSWED